MIVSDIDKIYESIKTNGLCPRCNAIMNFVGYSITTVCYCTTDCGFLIRAQIYQQGFAPRFVVSIRDYTLIWNIAGYDIDFVIWCPGNKTIIFRDKVAPDLTITPDELDKLIMMS